MVSHLVISRVFDIKPDPASTFVAHGDINQLFGNTWFKQRIVKINKQKRRGSRTVRKCNAQLAWEDYKDKVPGPGGIILCILRGLCGKDVILLEQGCAVAEAILTPGPVPGLNLILRRFPLYYVSCAAHVAKRQIR